MAKITKIIKNSIEYDVGSGDVQYSDFGWVTKSWATITLDLASTITPTANFTVNAPSTIKDGQVYVLRVTNEATAYTMTLWTNVTNPYNVSLTLTANWIDQFVFLAVGWNLELQPEGWEIWLSTQANNILTSWAKLWAGTESDYQNLGSYDSQTIYMTF